MYPNPIAGERIPCPTTYGRGTHVLCADYNVGEMFVHCIHLRQKTNRKTDRVIVSVGKPMTEEEANELYLAWRDEIFAQAAKYVN